MNAIKQGFNTNNDSYLPVGQSVKGQMSMMENRHDFGSENGENSLRIIKTGDGVSTLYNSRLDEIYHSRSGAWNETLHVFIDAGLSTLKHLKEICILEPGFGTGLNFLATALYCGNRQIRYTGLEPYPVPVPVLGELNPGPALQNDSVAELFRLFHDASWSEIHRPENNIYFRKLQLTLQEYDAGEEKYNLIYFDAFSRRVQPELWTPEIFSKLFAISEPGCILVTYASGKQIRRAMEESGWTTEILPGPGTKREMLRAKKPSSSDIK
ncbi:MAG: tRNA (5-methylaminomethyl-2-thiouridine)(34)-methyltransferase MnmD [Bacteroidales bacterium]